MKKILAALFILLLGMTFTACEPTTAVASMNTNLTQSTTTDTSTYIPVTDIEIIADIQEPCQGTIITLTVNVFPSNATNQNYTITVNPTTMLTFVSASSQLQLEVTAQGTSGEIEENIVTVTSDDNSSITDTESIYVYPTNATATECEVN